MTTQVSPAVLREMQMARAIMHDALRTDSLRLAAKAIGDFSRRHQKLYDEVVKPSPLLLGLLADLQREDKEFRDLAERARSLGAHGWTLPLWAAPQLLRSFLADDDHDSVERALVRYYNASRGQKARTLVRSACDSAQLSQWRRLLRQSSGAFARRQYSIVVPALFSVLEGLLAQAAGVPRSRKPATMYAAAGRELAQSGIAIAAWASVQGFVEITFRHHPFSAAPPVLNRHWALHGRAEPLWGRIEALKLWQAISTIASLEP